MTGMELYGRFVVLLAFGLAGLGVVLMTVLDRLFLDWDPAVAYRRWWREQAQGRSKAGLIRAEDLLAELEGSRERRYAEASAPADRREVDRRREILRDMREAERRVSSPRSAEAL